MKDNNMNTEKKKRLVLILVCVVAFIIIILFIFKLALSNNDKNKSNVDGATRFRGVYRDTEVLEWNTYSLGSACTSDTRVCVDSMNFSYDEDRGIINYKVVNNCEKYCLKDNPDPPCDINDPDVDECPEPEEATLCVNDGDCGDGKSCKYQDNCGDQLPAGKLRVVLGNYKLVLPYTTLTKGTPYEGFYGYDNYQFSFPISDYHVYHSGSGDNDTMYETFDEAARSSIVVN